MSQQDELSIVGSLIAKMQDLATLIETSPRYTVHVWREDKRETEYAAAALSCLQRLLKRPSANIQGFAIPNETANYTARGTVLRFLATAKLELRMDSAIRPIETIVREQIMPACQTIVDQIEAVSPDSSARIITAPLELPHGLSGAVAENEHLAVRLIHGFDCRQNRQFVHLDVVFGF